MSKHICIISFSPIARDARVLRQIKYFSPRYDLTVIGFGDAHPAWDDSPTIQWRPVIREPSTWGVRLSELALLTVAGYVRPSSYEHWYWRRPHHSAALELARATPCDAYHANDWEALPIAVEAARTPRAKVVFDAHEYSPLEFEDRPTWRLLYARPITYFLRKYAPAVDASTTVAPAIAEKYCREFGLDPAVVLNCPEKMDLQPRPVDPGCIRMIYHGMAQRGRRLEIMIEAMVLADPRYRLHLMLLGEPAYIGELQAQAGRVAPDRITFHPPVPPAEIGAHIAEFDIGVFILPPVNFNWTVALPNKLFDYINAGLATCIGPSPEMARLVREYGCGVVAPSFDPAEVAAALNALRPEDIHAMKQGSVRARETLNAQVEMSKVIDLYDRLLGRGGLAMCGIFGIWQRNGQPVDLAAVRQATATLRHRGPDDEGYLLADTICGSALACAGDDTDSRLSLPHIAQLAGQPYDLAFGFRRLAILDLSPAGHQPMSSPDDRFGLIFNGEVYNYLELRDELRGFGHAFRSGSDSEVILAAYAQWGPECLARFNGMWALAIWDRVERSLFLARDRFGVKPLYYAADGSAFRFASEIKALVGEHGLVFKPSAAAIYDYLAGALLPGPQDGETFFEGLCSLPPGRWLMVRQDGLTEQRFWALPPSCDVATDANPTAVAARYRELFVDAVRLRLRSDVAVGTCLSGGVDSSSIVCAINRLIAQEGVAAAQIGARQKTFSAVYDTAGRYNERPHIERVLQATGAEGNFTVPTLERLSDDLARLVWHQDEPFLSTSIFAQWCVMRLAHERGITVLLDGQGADEQLGGYLPYVLFLEDLIHRGQIGRAWQEARDLQAQTGRSAAALMARALSRQVRGPWIDGRRRQRRAAEIDTAALNSDFAAAHGNSSARWWRDVEQHTLNEHLADMIADSSLPHLLRYEDRNSMAFSIEARVPFLDYRFVLASFAEAAPWRIHAGWSKWILRKAMEPLVPPEIIWRKDKVGFETPEVAWTQRLLADELGFFDDALCRDYLDVAEVKRRLAAWPTEREDVRQVWRWINLAIWLRVWHGARI